MRLWFRRDLLAKTERLAESRSTGSTARVAAGQVARDGADRSCIRYHRFLVGTTCWGGRNAGPNSTDRSQPGSKRQHILVDANGVPFSAMLSGVIRNDVTQSVPLVDTIPPILDVRDRPFQKPRVICADRGYDWNAHRPRLRKRDIKPAIARRRTEHGSGVSKFRWGVDWAQSSLHSLRRVRIPFDDRADIHKVFLKFGYALVCWYSFRRAEPPF